MSLVAVVLELALVVAAMLAGAALALVGPTRLLATLRDLRWRLAECRLPMLALGGVLVLRWVTTDVVTWVEWRVIENNITPYLFELDRSLFPDTPVAFLQSYQSPELTTFFVFVYIYGYAFLLLFPFVAYVALDEMDHLETLLRAFTLNYAIGLVCYVVFIAYGPRNVDPLLFEGLLYDAFPQARVLTNTVNQNTNVFPSLHTSLSTTVVALAWTTREEYPVWLVLSGALAISVVVSTMYLGIHWFSDVVAGTALALVSVYAARTYRLDDGIDAVRRYVDARVAGRRRPDRE